jgi:Zn-dependent M28 family amino/carboxypeptidase
VTTTHLWRLPPLERAAFVIMPARGSSGRPEARRAAPVRAAALVAVLAVALALAAPATAAQPTPRRIAAAITFPGMQRHLGALQAIAMANGGNRAAGTPGYAASRDYVVARLRRSGYRPTVQPFFIDRFVELAPSVLERTAPDPAPLPSATIEYSATGDVTGPAVPVDLALEPPRDSTSGCEAADFAGFPAGAVAVIQRGTCLISDKIDNAAAAGAVAAIVFNQGDTPDREALSPLFASHPAPIPALTASFATGADLAARPAAVRVATQTRIEKVETWNVITQTPSRGRSVVMLGAHLDSVPEGPGINDDGSGVAFLLELADQAARRHLRGARALRFGFWGAEEEGLFGSQAFVDSLTAEDRARTAAYLNFDMLGSPNGLRLVFDGDGGGDPEQAGPPGSVRIEHAFERWFAARGLATEPTPLDGRSDYEAFAAAGIPVGGLFSGAEEVKTEAQWKTTGGIVDVAADPNYHTPADRVSNVNAVLLRQLARAGAFVATRFALEPRLLPPR